MITYEMGIQLAKEINAASYIECSSMHLKTKHVFLEAINVSLRKLSIVPPKDGCVLQ